MSREADFDFDELVGGEFDFYGVNEIRQRFRLDDTTYEIEDFEDSYELTVSEYKETSLEGLPIARVTIEHDNMVYKLIDLHDGYEWLQFGMAVIDNPWPCFVFDYFPKASEDQ